jgi:hypothetical protein
MMNKTLIILSVTLLASCGPSAEEKKKIAAVTCSIMGETKSVTNIFGARQFNNMDAAVRVREMNEARERIGGEPFLGGDDAIKEAFKQGLCQELVLGISKPTVKEEFHPNGKLKSRTNYKAKNAGYEKYGLVESYYENGQLKATGNYKDGKLEGQFVAYRENGNIATKGNYKEGRLDGEFESYTNGQYTFTTCYRNGQITHVSSCSL